MSTCSRPLRKTLPIKHLLGRTPSILHLHRLFIATSAIFLLLVSVPKMPAQNGPAAASAPQTTPSAPSDQAVSANPPNEPLPQSPSPSAPQDAQGRQTVPDDRAPQTKRILGIVPNFRAVSTDEKLPPQSVKDKFMDATEDSFDYSSIFIPGFLAGYSMATKQYPEFHQGAAGYARYFWHSAVDQTSENYLVEFVVPVIAHEDTRYYTLGRGGFFERAGYALSRAVVTRSDSGRETFNFGEVVGAGASAGLSSLYYPSRERSLSNTGQEWVLDVAIDAASFMGREFWPDINRKLFHGKN